jgi:hypothetical protein
MTEIDNLIAERANNGTEDEEDLSTSVDDLIKGKDDAYQMAIYEYYSAGFVYYVKNGYNINLVVPVIFEKTDTALTTNPDSILVPGDTLFFNHYSDIFIYSPGIPFLLPPRTWSVKMQIKESGTVYGVDHTAIYIGDGQYIHASGKGVNTTISQLAPKAHEIVLIGRPINAIM